MSHHVATESYSTIPATYNTASSHGTVYRSPVRDYTTGSYTTASSNGTGTVYRSPVREYTSTGYTTSHVGRPSGYTTIPAESTHMGTSGVLHNHNHVYRTTEPYRTSIAHADYSTSLPARTYTTTVPTETVVHRSPVREYVVSETAHAHTARVGTARAATHEEANSSYQHATHHADGRLRVGEVARMMNIPVEELTRNPQYPQYVGLKADSPVPNAHGYYTRELTRVAPPPPPPKVVAPPPPPPPKPRDLSGLQPFVGFGLTETDSTKGNGSLPVETIWENGPAWDAGLRIGDQVARIGNDDQPINSLQQVQQKLMKTKVGEPLRVVALRNNEPKELTVVPKTTNAKAAQQGWNDIYFDTKQHKKLGESTQ